MRPHGAIRPFPFDRRSDPRSVVVPSFEEISCPEMQFGPGAEDIQRQGHDRCV